jgi:hypothetical protein
MAIYFHLDFAVQNLLQTLSLEVTPFKKVSPLLERTAKSVFNSCLTKNLQHHNKFLFH